MFSPILCVHLFGSTTDLIQVIVANKTPYTVPGRQLHGTFAYWADGHVGGIRQLQTQLFENRKRLGVGLDCYQLDVHWYSLSGIETRQ